MHSKFILALFPDSSISCQFTTVLLRLIYKVLLGIESEAIEEQSWFYDVAANGKNIQECGTFRRALSYQVERKITPILACVISQIDVNSNLKLLFSSDEGISKTWLELFSSEEFLNLEVLSTAQDRPMKRKKMDLNFVSLFPFSSAIREKMTSIVRCHLNDGMYLLIYQGFYTFIASECCCNSRLNGHIGRKMQFYYEFMNYGNKEYDFRGN